MKPKRVGTITNDYRRFKVDIINKHPIYEYRGYYIERSYAVAGRPSATYYGIYREYENGKLSSYDFNLNPDNGFKRLGDAVSSIDYYLKEHENNDRA